MSLLTGYFWFQAVLLREILCWDVLNFSVIEIWFPAKCYQCAYNPADVTVEHIQVPRTVYDEIQVPRTVYDEVQVPRVVYDDVTVTHVEYDEVEVPRVVYEEVQVPRVVYETTQVPRVVEDYVQPKVRGGVM